MRRPWTWWLAWGLFGLFLAITVGAFALDAATRLPDEPEESLWSDIPLVLGFGAFAAVGALVAARQPRNAVGWLFLACPLFAITAAFSEEYAYSAFVGGEALPLPLVFAWLYGWTWFPALGAIGLVVLLFPDGRPPSRRWRPVLWAYVALVTLTTIGAAVSPGPIDAEWRDAPDKPLTVDGLEGFFDVAEVVSTVMLLFLLGALLASVVVRVRRSRGDERQQLKWMLVAVAFFVAHIVVTEMIGGLPSAVVNLLFAFAVASIPVAAGIAILKYRLYDVDVVIRKTLVYGALTVLLGAAYVALVLAGQALFSSVAGGSDLAIAVSTLVVAALFLPVRARVQRLVDRRFYRRRYDAQRTLAAFGGRLREQVDLADLQADLESVVAETVQPTHLSLWLRQEAGT
jgi:hypothetical protein